MNIRRFKIGEVCVHKGYICRVEASERCIVGVTSTSAYSLKDGTELNPTLTLVSVYGPDGEPTSNPKSRKTASGNVEYAQDALEGMRNQIALLQKKITLLESMIPPKETKKTKETK